MTDITETQPLPSITNSGWTYWPRVRRNVALAFGIPSIFCALLWFVGLRNMGFGIAALLSAVAGFVAIIPMPNARTFFFQSVAEIFENRRAKKAGPYRSPPLNTILNENDLGDLKRTSIEPVQPRIIPTTDGYLSEVSTPHNKRHTLFITGDGIGGSATGSPAEIIATSNVISDALKNVSDEYGGLGLFGAMFALRVPPDMTNAQNYFDTRQAEGGERLSTLQENYQKMMLRTQLATGDLRAGIGISTPRPAGWNSAQVSDDEIRKAIGHRLTGILRDDLAPTGLRNVRRPNPWDTTVMVRGMLDTLELDSLYADYFQDRQTIEANGGKIDFNDSLVMSSGMLPDAWVRGHSYLRIGDTFSRTFYVPGFNYRRVEAGVMSRLYSAPYPIMYGISTVFQTVRAKNEVLRNRLRRAEVDRKRLERQKRGSSARASEVDAEQQIDEIDTLMFMNHGEGVQMNLLAFTCGESIDELNVNQGLLERMFREVGLPLRQYMGASLQIPVRLAMLGIRSDGAKF